MATNRKTTSTTRPLTEGYLQKGGQNISTSKVTVRPPAPAKISTGSNTPSRKPAKSGG